MDLKVVAIVQARVASTRLPGKVLADIEGEPMLVREVERAQRAATVDELVVATSTEPGDEQIATLCLERGYACYRGSPLDVLDRIYQAARAHQAQTVVRLTGDCPLIDPVLIDQTVTAFLEAEPPVDFAANRLPNDKTFPVGTDTEVCTLSALERAWREANEPHHREHVMPYLYEVPGQFRTLLVRSDQDYSQYRWTVDSPEDLELVRQVYAHFSGRDDFTWLEVLELYGREPGLASMNAEVQHKSQFDLDPGWSS
ncbi:MAG: cytidylyltransferase domain-containing protein [Anaerolineales bacterium]